MEIETLSTETYVADALTRFHFQCKLHRFCSVDANQPNYKYSQLLFLLSWPFLFLRRRKADNTASSSSEDMVSGNADSARHSRSSCPS